jgi:hypothetical protein
MVGRRQPKRDGTATQIATQNARSGSWTATTLRIVRFVGAVLFGLALVAVPTAYSIFPGLTLWSRDKRWLVLVSWLFLAVVGTAASVVANNALHAGIERDEKRLVVAEHRSVIRDHFRTLFAPDATGFPPIYQFTVYAPTPDEAYLVPVYPPIVSANDPAIFPSGAGATGLAWEEKAPVIVYGAAVSDSQHGLTLLQQRRYAGFSIVVATIIYDLDETPLGVLSVIGRDDGFFDNDDALTSMDNVADDIAWLMSEAIRWMMPTDEELAGVN